MNQKYRKLKLIRPRLSAEIIETRSQNKYDPLEFWPFRRIWT